MFEENGKILKCSLRKMGKRGVQEHWKSFQESIKGQINFGGAGVYINVHAYCLSSTHTSLGTSTEKQGGCQMDVMRKETETTEKN